MLTRHGIWTPVQADGAIFYREGTGVSTLNRVLLRYWSVRRNHTGLIPRLHARSCSDSQSAGSFFSNLSNASASPAYIRLSSRSDRTFFKIFPFVQFKGRYWEGCQLCCELIKLLDYVPGEILPANPVGRYFLKLDRNYFPALQRRLWSWGRKLSTFTTNEPSLSY